MAEKSRVFGECGKPLDVAVTVQAMADTTGADPGSEAFTSVDWFSMANERLAWEECA